MRDMNSEEILKKKNIIDYDPDELIGVVSSYGEKNFRAKQIFGWIAKGVKSFNEMKNIPKHLRQKLDENFYIGLPEVIIKQKSKND